MGPGLEIPSTRFPSALLLRMGSAANTALEKLEQDLALILVTWQERDSSPLSKQFLFSFLVPHLLRQVALIAQFFDQVHLGFEKIHVTLFVFEQGNQ